MATLTWHGHACFQLESDGVNILFDPFLENNPSSSVGWDDIPAPDAIFITHDHGDHTGEVVELSRKSGAMVGAVVGTAQALVEMGVEPAQILNTIGFNIGGTLDINGIKVTMTQAFHSSESGVPVGYIVTLQNGYVLYHAGDTGIFSSMELWGKLYNINLSLLPMGGVFTMDPAQAAMACGLLQTDNVVPMHWGTFPVLEAGTEDFAAQLAAHAPATEMIHMQPGDVLEL